MHRQLQVLLVRVLELGVREAAQALARTASPSARRRGRPRRRRAAGRWGRRCDVPRHLADRLVAEVDQLGVEEDRLDLPDLVQRRPRSSPPAAKRSRARLGVGEHRGERPGVEVTLVEHLLRRLDDRRDDARLADDAARPCRRRRRRSLGDVPNLERELGGAGERIAPRVHRRRAGVRGLAGPGDVVALDAERAQHDADRQIQRLEHRALLDVQLEVGGGVLQLRARVDRAVEVDAVLGERVGQA